MKRERDAEAELNLPAGFRFHPTDEELVVHYLCRKAAGYQPLSLPFIAEIDLYKHDPWHLPEKALFGTKEWYFFTPRDRKYPNGSRPNRAAGSGYWKATGADKPIRGSPLGKTVGIKKALVFYTGTKAAKGIKTNWIMHEYRLAHPNPPASKGAATSRLDDWVLCRLYNKKNNWEAEKVRLEEGKKIIEEDDADRGELDNRKNSRHGHECYSDGDSSIVEQGDDDHDLTPGIHSPVTSTSTSLQLMEQDLEVDDGDKGSSTDWFTNLNLDDLHQLLATMPPVPADFTSLHNKFSHLHTRNF